MFERCAYVSQGMDVGSIQFQYLELWKDCTEFLETIQGEISFQFYLGYGLELRFVLTSDVHHSLLGDSISHPFE